LIDALLLSPADVMLAESFSNYVYSMPATLALAEGRIFCEAGRAALGGRYITQDDQQASLMGDPAWWAHPPPNLCRFDAKPRRGLPVIGRTCTSFP
jgi:hypothetical protein